MIQCLHYIYISIRQFHEYVYSLRVPTNFAGIASKIFLASHVPKYYQYYSIASFSCRA